MIKLILKSLPKKVRTPVAVIGYDKGVFLPTSSGDSVYVGSDGIVKDNNISWKDVIATAHGCGRTVVYDDDDFSIKFQT